MISSRDLVQGSALCDQFPDREPVSHSNGQVHVVRLRRRSRKRPGLLLFKGGPASRTSTARSVLVTIVPPNGELPGPWMDTDNGRIHLFYRGTDHPDVATLISDPGSCVCYLWTSADGRHGHAWLVKAR